MRAFAPVLALLLAGCQDGPVSRSEATDIAEDQADAATSQLRAQIEDLEARTDALEKRQKRTIEYVEAVENLALYTDNRVSDARRAEQP